MADVEILRAPPRFTVEVIRAATRAAFLRTRADRIVLFGSYARGTADRWSDVDLLVVARTERPFLERFRDYLDVLDALPGAELLIYTPAEIGDLRRRGGVVERALAEGIVLHDRPGAES